MTCCSFNLRSRFDAEFRRSSRPPLIRHVATNRVSTTVCDASAVLLNAN